MLITERNNKKPINISENNNSKKKQKLWPYMEVQKINK